MATVFLTDQQTLNDIGIFDRKSGVFELYDQTCTRGGNLYLEMMFRSPLTDVNEIKNRSDMIAHFRNESISFPFNAESIGAADAYLSIRDERSRLSATENGFVGKFGKMIATDQQRLIIEKGIHALVELFQQFFQFLKDFRLMGPAAFEKKRKKLLSVLESQPFITFLNANGKKLTNQQLIDFDVALRFKFFTEVTNILQELYFLDAIISVAKVASAHNWAAALPVSYQERNETVLEIKDLRHLMIKNAVGNSISLDSRENVLFLTGANMAGKSTLMKSIGLSVYLAHIGVPVAASEMTFTVLDGFYSTINLPDDLGMGASHFYAEVLRLKKVAYHISTGHRLFVMFDELFRGTNVKDAEEGTIAIAEKFANRKTSLFVISTHIIEAGEALRKITDGLQYVYMPTIMFGTRPTYTYLMKQGITNDRHGMLIMENEGLIELLNRGISTSPNQ